MKIWRQKYLLCISHYEEIHHLKRGDRKRKRSEEFKETSFHHAPSANFTVTSTSSVPFIKSSADKNLLARDEDWQAAAAPCSSQTAKSSPAACRRKISQMEDQIMRWRPNRITATRIQGAQRGLKRIYFERRVCASGCKFQSAVFRAVRCRRRRAQ